MIAKLDVLMQVDLSWSC